MAKVKAPQFVLSLEAALRQSLLQAGVTRAKIKYEPVEGTKLYRFIILSKGFENMGHSERQDLVWRIVNRELTPQDQLKISMILTMTSEEYAPR